MLQEPNPRSASFFSLTVKRGMGEQRINVFMVDISSQVGWIPIWESVPDSTSTLPISYHRATISLHLLLKERQESFIPIFYHSKAMVVMPWQRMYPSQQISFKQNTHRFSGWGWKQCYFQIEKSSWLSQELSYLLCHRAKSKKNQYVIVTYYQTFHLWSCGPYFLPFWQELHIWPKSSNLTSHHFVQFLFVFYIWDMLVSNKS